MSFNSSSPDSVTQKLQEIKELYVKGEYEQCLEQIVESELQFINDNINIKTRIEVQIYKARCFLRKGTFDTALDLAEKCFQDSMTVSSVLQIQSRVVVVYALWRKGHLDEALNDLIETELLYTVLTENERLMVREAEATLIHLKGNIYWSKGELDHALMFFQQSLVMRKEIGNQQDIAGSLNNIGNLYRTKGELDTALKYLEQSMEIAKKMNNQPLFAFTLNNIGKIYGMKGELDIAFKYNQQSLKIFINIGSQQSVVILLFDLISLSMNRKDHQSIYHQYFEKLEIISTSEIHQDDKTIQLYYNLAQALIFKSSQRMRIKNKAFDLLESIVNDEVIEHELTVLAMKHYIEFLLIELQTYGEIEALQEAKDRVDYMQKLAQEQHSFSILVDTLILQYKLELLTGDVTKAKEILQQAFNQAVHMGLTGLVGVITHEQMILERDATLWETLNDLDLPFSEKIRLNLVSSYIETTKRSIHRPIGRTSANAKPLMLLILKIGGLVKSSYIFSDIDRTDQSENTKLNPHMVGAFLSALNAFGHDAFASSGALEVIKYHNNNIISREFQSLFFNLIYAGDLQDPAKKLDNFIEYLIGNTELYNLIFSENVLDSMRTVSFSKDVEKEIISIFT